MRWFAWGLVVLLFACDEKKVDDKEAPAPSTEPAPEPTTLAAAELCELVMGASKRNLEASCSADDKKDPAYAYLAGVADDRVKQCILALKDDVGPGWATLPADRARACAAALEKRSWKDGLLGRSIAEEEACRDLIVGTRKDGESCHRDAACGEGLICVGATAKTTPDASSPSAKPAEAAPGTCKPPGAACGARAAFELGWLARPPCAAGQRCNAARPPRRFPLGYDAPQLAPPAPAGATDEAHAARQQALRDAVEFGMIGMLNSGGDDLHRGLDRVLRGLPPDDREPAPSHGLGLSGLAGGSPAPAPRYGVGFGGGLAKRPAPPRVRVGATNVSGRLAPEIIQRIVRRNFGRFRLCYENGLRSNPKLEGRVAVRFVIARDGSVSSVSGGGDMPDAAVTSCVTRAFYGLSFPPPEGGIVTVSYPIVFTPGDAKPKPPSAPEPAPEEATEVENAEPAPSAAAAPEGAVCVSAESCGHAGDCALGETCVSGQCRRLGGNAAPCAESLDCEPGLYCKRSGDAASCAPREKAGARCNTSLACEGYCSKDDVCVDFCGG